MFSWKAWGGWRYEIVSGVALHFTFSQKGTMLPTNRKKEGHIPLLPHLFQHPWPKPWSNLKTKWGIMKSPHWFCQNVYFASFELKAGILCYIKCLSSRDRLKSKWQLSSDYLVYFLDMYFLFLRIRILMRCIELLKTIRTHNSLRMAILLLDLDVRYQI